MLRFCENATIMVLMAGYHTIITFKLQIIELVSPPGFLCSSNYIVLVRHHGLRTLIIVKRVLICFYCLWFTFIPTPLYGLLYWLIFTLTFQRLALVVFFCVSALVKSFWLFLLVTVLYLFSFPPSLFWLKDPPQACCLILTKRQVQLGWLEQSGMPCLPTRSASFLPSPAINLN